jgi:hypothetical protein
VAHDIKSKTKDMLKQLHLSDDFDNSKNNYYPNSAYRHAKQQGFINARDILGSIETKQKDSDK